MLCLFGYQMHSPQGSSLSGLCLQWHLGVKILFLQGFSIGLIYYPHDIARARGGEQRLVILGGSPMCQLRTVATRPFTSQIYFTIPHPLTGACIATGLSRAQWQLLF